MTKVTWQDMSLRGGPSEEELGLQCCAMEHDLCPKSTVALALRMDMTASFKRSQGGRIYRTGGPAGCG